MKNVNSNTGTSFDFQPKTLFKAIWRHVEAMSLPLLHFICYCQNNEFVLLLINCGKKLHFNLWHCLKSTKTTLQCHIPPKIHKCLTHRHHSEKKKLLKQ